MNNLGKVRHDWTRDEIKTVFEMPFSDLMHHAQRIHREYFDPNKVQVCTLYSVKTGACPEDCSYCSQSGHYDTPVEKEKNMEVDDVLAAAKKAKAAGATRFCMGAAWRHVFDHEMDKVCELIKTVKDLGLETCATMGMVTPEQAKRFKASGLDYYNHNLDTSPEYYGEIISTRDYQARLDTLEHIRNADIKVCCGGIMGLGEQRKDRIGLLEQLANMKEHPKSVPINMLIAVPGTPLAEQEKIDSIEFIRMIATTRIVLPESFVRLSAGRTEMSREMQALCFLGGANSIFTGDKLLTMPNQSENEDVKMFEQLGIQPMKQDELETHA